jgi:hypothetical protein
MSGDLRIEIERQGTTYNVDHEMESFDDMADDVRCPNCDSHNVIEHRIGLTEVEIFDADTMEVTDLQSTLGVELLAEATKVANEGREKPFTCDDCQHSFS